MATVHLAEDLKHGRKVAIKVLKPEIARAVGGERFLREIQITAALSHPHILPLLDSGNAGGSLFYVMPLVAGESLTDRLKREKQLPLEAAITITREVADALSYAHAQGVVHRDIKPGNILLQSGHAVVADFGVGRAAGGASETSLTETGMSIGTPAYMSPEQASGSGEVDGRSDLYSLACVLYEMLAGRPPFTGPTLESVRYQHLMVEAPPITNLRPAVPAPVAAALARALAKTPADRFNAVARFADALGAPPRQESGIVRPTPADQVGIPVGRTRRPWLAALAAVVALAAVSLAVWAIFWNRGTSGRIERLAVLPLANLMADPGQDYFVDGMHEELLNQLGRIGGLSVLSRTSVLRFRGSDRPIGEIASALKVDAVVEGSIFRSADSVRITAQLIQAKPEKPLWSGSYDGALGEALGLQRHVAQAMASAISATLTGIAPGAVSMRRIDPAAQEAYLRGRFHLRTRTLDGMDKAVEYLNEATRIQPDFAEAYGGLAEAEVLRTAYRGPEWSRDQQLAGRDRARAAALRTLALDSTQAGALSTLGALSMLDLDWSGAEVRLRHAAELNPNYAQAWNWLGDLLDGEGRSTEAVEPRLRAQRLDPFAPVMNRDVGVSLIGAGRYGEALPYLRTSLEIQPDVAWGSWFLIICLVELARCDDAAREEERVLDRLGADSVVVRRFRETFAARGWQGVLSWLMGLTTSDLPRATGNPVTDVLAVPGLGRASALAYLGRTDEALDVLEKTLADPSTAGLRALELKWDPWLRHLRGHQRYTDLLRRYRFER